MAYIGRPINAGNLAVQSGTGDGSDTTPIATLNYATTTNGIAVYLDGVRQLAGTDYNVTAQTTLTFTTAPANGVGVDVYFLGLEVSIPTPADGTISTAKIANNAVDETKLKDALIGDFTDVTVTASDTFLYGDATDSGNTKRDTVQGILDLAGGGTKEFFVPFLYNSESTSSPAYNSNASNFIIAYNDATGEHVHANFHLPADYSSTTAFDIITIPGEAVTTNFNVAVSFGVDDEAASSSSDSVSGLGQSTTNGDIEVYNAINALNTGLAAGDYVGVKCTLASSVAHRFLGCRVKYS